MTKEQFDKERDFNAVTALAEVLLRRGIISKTDLRWIRQRALEEYMPAVSGLRRGGDTL
jgi:hypothetical protein